LQQKTSDRFHRAGTDVEGEHAAVAQFNHTGR